jgi:HPt (histidine-containing phosphotransfer) domain-containing protein
MDKMLPENILDPKAIESIRQLKTNPQEQKEMLAKLVTMFITNSFELIATAKSAATVDDRPVLTHSLHTLKGSAVFFGAIRVHAICESIEDEIDSLSEAKLNKQLCFLKDEFSKTENALFQFL